MAEKIRINLDQTHLVWLENIGLLIDGVRQDGEIFYLPRKELDVNLLGSMVHEAKQFLFKN